MKSTFLSVVWIVAVKDLSERSVRRVRDVACWYTCTYVCVGRRHYAGLQHQSESACRRYRPARRHTPTDTTASRVQEHVSCCCWCCWSFRIDEVRPNALIWRLVEWSYMVIFSIQWPMRVTQMNEKNVFVWEAFYFNIYTFVSKISSGCFVLWRTKCRVVWRCCWLLMYFMKRCSIANPLSVVSTCTVLHMRSE